MVSVSAPCSASICLAVASSRARLRAASARPACGAPRETSACSRQRAGKMLPAVFDNQRRPWIIVDNGSPGDIGEVIQRCPTGALHFRRLDGGPQEPVPVETKVQERPNGPLFVRGDVTIFGEDHTLVRHDTRVALCRCGASANKPFCDGSHRRVGFRTTHGPA
jgi:CDGSH-type Zn-finger protein/uncharacterized Fe-S cluster protein YjdI